MSYNIFCKPTDSLLHTLPPSIKSLFKQEYQTRRFKKIASEHNDNLRANYIAWMGQYNPEQLGFIDKDSKDEWASIHTWGQLRKGFHAIQKGVFVQGRCFSVTGLLTLDGMVLNNVVEWSMTRAPFLTILSSVWLWCSFLSSRTLVHCLAYIAAIVFCFSRSSKCPCNG